MLIVISKFLWPAMGVRFQGPSVTLVSDNLGLRLGLYMLELIVSHIENFDSLISFLCMELFDPSAWD